MYFVDELFYFIIDEKNCNVELIEFGVEYFFQGIFDFEFFIMLDIVIFMVEIDDNDLMIEEEKQEVKIKFSQDFLVKFKCLYFMSQLLKVYMFFEKDQEYVVMDGQVKIVDEQMGCMMEGCCYFDGLYQVLEVKENVKIGDIIQIYVIVMLQNYFWMYYKLFGMMGIVEMEASEFWEIYKLDVAVIFINRLIVWDDWEDLIFKIVWEKFNVVIDEIVNLMEQGCLVLVGMIFVEVFEVLSWMLKFCYINYNVLNVKQYQCEVEVVVEVGKLGNVIIVINMAGWGMDIKIGQEVKDSGGLVIIGIECYDFCWVDWQLCGCVGCQGDFGSLQFYVLLEDNFMCFFQFECIVKLMDCMGYEEGEVVQYFMVIKFIEWVQKKVEENNFGICKWLLEYDDVMNIQWEVIYKKRKNVLVGD